MKKNNVKVTRSLEIPRVAMTAGEFLARTNQVSANNMRGSEEIFHNVELADLTLENKSLANSEFNYSKLSNITFRGVNFQRAEFIFTELSNVTFERCKLENCKFDYSAMTHVRFEQCIMDYDTFDFACGDAVFASDQLSGAEFHHTFLAITMADCEADRVEINYCPALTIHAENCDFHRGEFTDGIFRGAMKKCIFTDADFSGSNAAGLTFSECGMRSIDTSSATGIDPAMDDDDEFELDLE